MIEIRSVLFHSSAPFSKVEKLKSKILGNGHKNRKLSAGKVS